MATVNRLSFFTTYFILLILVALCAAVQESHAEKEITLTKLGKHVGSPTLKFLYCYSCGYRKMFDDYVNIIQQKYPDIVVDGGNYEPSGVNLFLSRLIGILKLFIIVCVLGGVNVFLYFGLHQPGWWTWCIENKLYACMMLFFLSNMVEVQLMSSGAFEITLNDVPVWSKLETGRIPQPNELFQIIDSHMQFAENRIEVKPGFAKQ